MSIIPEKISLHDRLSYAGKRIKDEKSKLLKYKNFSIRDEEAFHKTANGIAQSIKNGFYASDGLAYDLDLALMKGLKNQLAATNANFSEESDLGGVEDMQVVDIALATITSSSALNFLAVDTAMESLTTNVTFQSLVAANSAAGVNKGDVIVDPRLSLDPKINIGKSGAVHEFSGALSDGISVSDNKPVLTRETKIYVDYGTDTQSLVGFALNKGINYGTDASALKNTKDEIVFKKVVQGITISDDGAFIDVTNGKITGITCNAGTITVVYCIDRTGEVDGANTLRLKVKNTNIIMRAERNRLHLENSIENIVEMNKIYANNADMGISVDYGKRAFQQLALINKFFYDTQIVRTLWDGAKNLPVEEFIDLSGYPTTDFKSFSPTKDNYLQKGMMSLNQKFLYRTGRGVTAWVVDSISALMLGNSSNFVKSDSFSTKRDGLIGTYDNIPVLRYAYLDTVNDQSISGEGAGVGILLGVFKDISGKAAPIAWGSYLMPYSTIPALNPSNPSQITSALYSMTACTLITDAWIIKGAIKSY